MATVAAPGELSSDQRMSLWLGDPSDGAFPSPEARRSAWFRHRRPMAWWQYEKPPTLKWPGHEHERKHLFLASLLGEAEEKALLDEWRGVWLAAQALTGMARQAAYEAADIPRCVLTHWRKLEGKGHNWNGLA
jgi:hypothetical protein